MNTVYCRKNDKGTLDFYAHSAGGECYLFTQKFYKNYDLCLNATLGREACADLIVAAARAMQEADK